MKKVAYYARVSTSLQEEQKTIESQIFELKEQIKKDGNLLIKEYVDNGHSGAEIDRPALNELRKDLSLDFFETVYFLDADRIARNSTYQDIIISELLGHGKEIIINGKSLLYDSTGRFNMRILGAVSEFERAKIIERSTRGRREKSRQGQIMSGVNILGYDFIPKMKEQLGRLVVNEKEAEIVRFIFDTYANSESSLTGIIKKLEEKSYLTKNGNKVWQDSTVKRILHNTTYYGERFYNQTNHKEIPWVFSTSSSGKKRIIQKQKKEDWISIQVPAIIEKELFDRTQVKMEKNHKLTRNTGRKYMLSSLIECGDCGSTYVGYQCSSSKKPAYRCNYRRKSVFHTEGSYFHKCANKGVTGSRIEGRLWELIDEIVLQPAVIKQHIEMLKEKAIEQQKFYLKEFKEIENKSKYIKEKRKKAFEAHIKGIVPETDYTSVVNELEKDLNKLEVRRSEIADDIVILKKREYIERDINYFCQLAKERLKKENFENKRKFLLEIIDKITFLDDQITIEGAIPLTINASDSNTDNSYSMCWAGGDER